MWAAYLGLLILFVVLAYANVVSQGAMSVAQVQTELKSFYVMVMSMLEIVVGLVGPVLVAMSIQAERQRLSLELIMTAPVSPKYFLVGKVVSGYRYIVMLLFLSLPITAAAVVLGGVTWSEVLISYALIAAHGLLYIAISLPIAILCNKVVTTVVYSYIACWGIGLFSSLSVVSMFSFGGGMGMDIDVPFWMLIFPMGFAYGASSVTEIFGVGVPGWILAVATILAFTKLFVLAAGSAMTRAGSKETMSLRIHGLVYTLGFSLLILIPTVRSAAGFAGEQELAIVIATLTIPFILIAPNLSTWSLIDGKKWLPNTPVSFRGAIRGTPDGGLVYFLMLLSCIFVAAGVAFFLSTGVSIDTMAIYLFWIAATWTFFWSMGWLLSSFVKTGIGTARKSHLAFTIITALMPWPVLAIISAAMPYGTDVWVIYPLVALKYQPNDIYIVFLMAAEFSVFAAIAIIWGERRRKKSVSLNSGANDEEQTA